LPKVFGYFGKFFYCRENQIKLHFAAGPPSGIRWMRMAIAGPRTMGVECRNFNVPEVQMKKGRISIIGSSFYGERFSPANQQMPTECIPSALACNSYADCANGRDLEPKQQLQFGCPSGDKKHILNITLNSTSF
jgi:hypothetical protein